jgi:hypothetical protein
MTMNVVAFGNSIPPGDVNEDLVETLQGLLDRAKSGDLRALAYATVSLQGFKGTGWDGSDGTRDPLASAIMMLHGRYAQALLEQ